MKQYKLIIWILVILLSFTSVLATTLPIYVRPLLGGSIQENTMFEYTFNFTSNMNCSNVLFSTQENITTDGYGLGVVSLNVSSLTVVPSYLCEYRDGALREVHPIGNIFSNTLFTQVITFLDNTTLTSGDWDNIYGLFDNISNFTGTLTPGKLCTYDGSEIDCNVEPISDQSLYSTDWVIFDNINLTNIVAGVDNTVIIEGAGGQLKKDEIDSRVWGGSLIDGGGAAGHIPYYTDANTISYDSAMLAWDPILKRMGIGMAFTTWGAVTIRALSTQNALAIVEPSGSEYQKWTMTSSGDLYLKSDAGTVTAKYADDDSDVIFYQEVGAQSTDPRFGIHTKSIGCIGNLAEGTYNIDDEDCIIYCCPERGATTTINLLPISTVADMHLWIKRVDDESECDCVIDADGSEFIWDTTKTLAHTLTSGGEGVHIHATKIRNIEGWHVIGDTS